MQLVLISICFLQRVMDIYPVEELWLLVPCIRVHIHHLAIEDSNWVQ